MTSYRNFTVDLPKRIQELDQEFSPIAMRKNLDVTYLLMKSATAFLLPYERVSNTSGATRSDINNTQNIRKYLELDKPFRSSTYCNDCGQWLQYNVVDYSNGPSSWFGQESKTFEFVTVDIILKAIRHAIAHSNLYFGGEGKDIEHIFFGKRNERDTQTGKYFVVGCTIPELNQLINSWLTNVQTLRVSPELIWAELEKAA